MEEKVLNKNQTLAAEHFEGPMLVLAGPGSGKTTVVVERVKKLIDTYHVFHSKILVITFTKAAAMEMEGRFRKFEKFKFCKTTFGTFHSLFFRIIRDYFGYTLENVLNEEDKWSGIKNIIRELEIETNDEEEYIKDFVTEYSKMKNDLIDLKYFNPFQSPKQEFQKICKRYEAFKERERKIDFDDMLTECFILFKQEPLVLKKWQQKYSFILIDEFQDINKVQYELIKLLALPENNLFVVGDDDQSIYKFRGARPEFLLHFPSDYKNCKKILLDINYRSTDSIIKLSGRLVKNNSKRFEKEFSGTGQEGKLAEFFVEEDMVGEAARIANKIQKLHKMGIPYDEMAVIFRTNMQAGGFVRAFMNNGIRFRLKDAIANVYEHWISRDLTSYIRLALDEGSNADFIKIVNKPKRYISKDILKWLEAEQGPMLKTIFTNHSLKTWQSKQIVDLKQHLIQIKKRKPYEAIKYIRNVVAYDEYLEEYAKYRKGNIFGMKEIADELTQTAKDQNSLEDFLLLIQKLSDETKQSRKTSEKIIEDSVTLSTLHSAKGLEFEAVFLPSIIEGVIPHEKSTRPEEIEEERRLFYVGITRAKSHLCLSEVLNRYDKETQRSRFLKELGLGERKNKVEKKKI